MHLALAIPALFPTHGALQDAFDSLRPPTLELLVARGRVEHGPRACFEAWLARAFDLEGDALPAGALTALADDAEPAVRDARWMRADPVHLHLAREHLRLVPSAALTLTQEEAAALCETLNAHFAGILSIHPSAHDARCWSARLEGAELPSHPPPLEAAGDDVDLHLRAQADAADATDAADVTRAHALLNELQMLLHEHPVNEAREARGEPAINSVWFWGAGQAPSRLQGRWRTVSADEPLALGLARLGAARAQPLPASADSWLADAPADGHHLIVLDGLRAPHALQDEERYLAGVQAIEARWLAPLLEALRTQRIGMLTLHVPDATEALSIETVRADLRRFWRRPRALAPWKD
jgi:hypothetical protein